MKSKIIASRFFFGRSSRHLPDEVNVYQQRKQRKQRNSANNTKQQHP
jgi:hypothetical protein